MLRISGVDRLDKGLHKGMVTAAVPATGRGISDGARIDRLAIPGEEVVDNDRAAIAGQLPTCAEDLCAARSPGGEGRHREGPGRATRKLHGHDLMIDSI